MEHNFKEWLISENYRISQAYRLALWQELQHLDGMPNAIKISHLRLVDFPKYNKYSGDLSREKQTAIFNEVRKLDKQEIYTTFIKENLTALATDTQR